VAILEELARIRAERLCDRLSRRYEVYPDASLPVREAFWLLAARRDVEVPCGFEGHDRSGLVTLASVRARAERPQRQIELAKSIHRADCPSHAACDAFGEDAARN
jgi:hypothetical protein